MVSFFEVIANTLAPMFPRSAYCVAERLATLYCRDGSVFFPDFDNESDAVKFIVCNFIHPCGDCDWLGLCCYDLPWCLNCYDAGKAVWQVIEDVKRGAIQIDSCFPASSSAQLTLPPPTPTQLTTQSTPTASGWAGYGYETSYGYGDLDATLSYMIENMMNVMEMQLVMNIIKEVMGNINAFGGSNSISGALKPLMDLIPVIIVLEAV